MMHSDTAREYVTNDVTSLPRDEPVIRSSAFAELNPTSTRLNVTDLDEFERFNMTEKGSQPP